MLFEKYDLLVNPLQERWNEIAALTHDQLEWKSSFHDYESFLNGHGRDNFKFLVAVDRETGRAAACICGNLFPSVDGSPELFTIGLYYTHPDHRCSGLGRKLFEQLMNIGHGSNMFLIAVPSMAQKYSERSGFENRASWELKIVEAHAKDTDLARIEMDESVKVVDFKDVGVDKLAKYDQGIGGGVHRQRFLEKFLTQKEAWNKFAVNENGDLIGYCNARITYGNHVVLGPFYADSPVIASTLLRKTLETVPDFSTRSHVMILLPNDNPPALDMFSKMADGKVKIDMNMPRLFTDKVIESPSEKIFSIAEYDTNFI